MRLGARTDSLLFGRDPRRSTRLLLAAAVLFVGALLVHLLVRGFVSVSVTGTTVFWTVFGCMFLVATAGAYVNDGLLVAVALAAGVGLGFYAPLLAFGLGNVESVTLWVLAVGTVSGVLTGVLGFLAGVGGRRLVGPA